MKGWKQALFLGGAVLLLAACSDATAPVAQLQDGKAPASANLFFGPIPTTTTTSPTPLPAPKPIDVCRTPVVIQLGRTEVAAECNIEF